ncbi:hypothetical protein GCM10020331_064740 [Ectobacillus funiculus]
MYVRKYNKKILTGEAFLTEGPLFLAKKRKKRRMFSKVKLIMLSLSIGICRKIYQKYSCTYQKNMYNEKYQKNVT